MATMTATKKTIIRAKPIESDSIDAKRWYATRPDRAYRYCQTVLREQLAEGHRLDVSQLAR